MPKTDKTPAPDPQSTPAPENPAPPPAPAVTIESLEAENASLKQQLANLTAQRAQTDADEQIIAEKMRVGLTRTQALSVLRRQREYEATSMAKARKAFAAQPDSAAYPTAQNPSGGKKTVMQLFAQFEAERIKSSPRA